MMRKREIMIIVVFWSLIIALMVFLPKPVSKVTPNYASSEFPDTDGTVMYNVTIDQWEKNKHLGTMYFDELHIKE